MNTLHVHRARLLMNVLLAIVIPTTSIAAGEPSAVALPGSTVKVEFKNGTKAIDVKQAQDSSPPAYGKRTSGDSENYAAQTTGVASGATSDKANWTTWINITGFIGAALGIYNLWRAKKASQEVRSLTYAQRKQEALDTITDYEAVSINVVAEWLKIEDKLQDEKLPDLLPCIAPTIQDERNLLKEALSIRTLILAREAEGRSHAELIRLIDREIAPIRGAIHAGAASARHQELMHSTQRSIDLAVRARSEMNGWLAQISEARSAYWSLKFDLEALCHDAKSRHQVEDVKDIQATIGRMDSVIDRLETATRNITEERAKNTSSDVRTTALNVALEQYTAVREILGVEKIREAGLVRVREIKRAISGS